MSLSYTKGEYGATLEAIAAEDDAEIAQERIDRDAAIAAAIANEVTARNSAIATAVAANIPAQIQITNDEVSTTNKPVVFVDNVNGNLVLKASNKMVYKPSTGDFHADGDVSSTP